MVHFFGRGPLLILRYHVVLLYRYPLELNEPGGESPVFMSERHIRKIHRRACDKLRIVSHKAARLVTVHGEELTEEDVMMFVDGDSVYVEDKYSTQRLKRSVSPTREKLSKEQRKLKKHRLKLKDKEPEWLRISERLEEKMEEAVAQYLEHHPHVQPHRSPQHIASPEAVQQEGDTEMEEKEGEESSKGSQKPLTLPEPSGKQLEMLEFRKRLPAFAHSKDIVSKVSMHQVVVISGETGCGKTTQVPMWLFSGVYCRYSALVFVLQVPQFLLDDAIERNPLAPVQIICTQPRRISAIGVAERVAAERGDSIGSSVGYQIRLERRASADTRLLFCTTGACWVHALLGSWWMHFTFTPSFPFLAPIERPHTLYLLSDLAVLYRHLAPTVHE